MVDRTETTEFGYGTNFLVIFYKKWGREDSKDLIN
jgi:hypothetical protein